jgi:hypothetical protein
MTIRHRTISIFVFLFFLSMFHSSAEVFISQKYGYAIDLPEAFNIIQRDTDERGYLFNHAILPVTLAVKIYNSGEYTNADAALTGAFNKLNAGGDRSAVKWRNTDCILSSFSMKTEGSNTKQKGWTTAVDLPDKKTQLIVLCYADENKEAGCEQLILSVIDSIMIDRGSFFEPGIVTTFAYPATSPKQVALIINNIKINTEIDSEDAEAAKFIIDREYAVLSLYAAHKNWKEAWQRYYRMIFRDSYKRLTKPAADIYKALFADAVKQDSQQPEAVIAQMLLTWSQNFQYVRDPKNSDFTDLISEMTGTASDCDSRSLLLCVLMENMGIKSTLFISHEYSHAVAGFDIDRNGAKISAGGKNYLLAETTAHVNLGLIAQDMSDTTKWIPVELP